MSNIDYIVKEYHRLSDLQKDLNQWKNEFDLTFETIKIIPDQYYGSYYVLVIIKRKRKPTFESLCL